MPHTSRVVTCPVCNQVEADVFGVHSLSCMHGGLRTILHNAVCQAIHRTASQGMLGSAREWCFSPITSSRVDVVLHQASPRYVLTSPLPTLDGGILLMSRQGPRQPSTRRGKSPFCSDGCGNVFCVVTNGDPGSHSYCGGIRCEVRLGVSRVSCGDCVYYAASIYRCWWAVADVVVGRGPNGWVRWNVGFLQLICSCVLFNYLQFSLSG